MNRRHLAVLPATTGSVTALLLSPLLFGAPAWADPGLGSLEGLWILYLIYFAVLLVALLAFAFAVRTGIRWLRGDDPGRARSGRLILIALGLLLLVSSTRFIDFSLYLLRDNTRAEATTISRAHVERYMETADGRAFYLADTGLRYFKPGREIVLKTDASGSTRVYDIFEAKSSMYHRLSDKKFWIPIIPTKKDRFALEDRGPVVMLDRGWRYEDLAAGMGNQRISWCCELDWVRLLVERGADPDEPTGGMLPLYQVVSPIGWHHDEQHIAEVEAVLEHLLAVGVDVNATNDRGDTALHQLTLQPFSRSIAWLLEHGADPTLTNSAGRTPIDLMLERRERSGRYWDSEKITDHREIVDMMSNSTSSRPSHSGTQ